MSAGGRIGSHRVATGAGADQRRAHTAAPDQPDGVSRRTFVGYLIAGATLIAAVPQFIAPDSAQAAIPTHQPVDDYDLSDLLNEAAAPTSGLITVVVNTDGTVSFALPRAEVGQGITTAVAMVIADEMGLALDKVTITLADARPELVWNQLTGGSNTMHSIFYPVRAAAAIAKGQLIATASNILREPADDLSLASDGVRAPNGKSISIGALATKARVTTTRQVSTTLTSNDYTLVGTPQGRIDALDIVTGRKQFAMDLPVPGALPTMVCRPPTINGAALSINNLSQVEAMSGVTDVALIPHTPFVAGGVAVRATTFGQCIDAIEALDVTWAPGDVAGLSDADVKQELLNTQLPLTPALPLVDSLEQNFTFYFRPGDPLETNCAVANVTSTSAEVWSSLKSPIWAKEQLVTILGLPLDAITVHVAQGGGSFGRHLFADAAFEAAAISQAIGKPVKLMWHRTDNFRQGRTHPMAVSKIRVQYSGANVLTFDQTHASVATDFSMGFGEVISATLATLPGANSLGYSQAVFNLTQQVPYNFGVVAQLLNEAYAYNTFNTGSTRNIYSPDVVTAIELMVDRTAAAMNMDPVAFRRAFVRDSRLLAVLNAVAQAGNWGRTMAPGTAQGVGLHGEYKSACACLVEIDCTSATVNRQVPNGFTGPRVTKVVTAVDVGLAVNPLGLEAQIIGGAMDGIANALTYSLHLTDGYFLEGSWDNAYYTREWNVPFDVQVIVMPPTTGEPGGAGELGVAPAMAATACAYARATGTVPTEFPINHNQPLGFTPYPTVPPIPQSPTNGLSEAF